MKKTVITTGITCLLAIASANAEDTGDWCENRVDSRAGNPLLWEDGREVYPLTFDKKLKIASTLLFGLDRDVIYNIHYSYDMDTIQENFNFLELDNTIQKGRKIVVIKPDDDSSSGWKTQIYDVKQEGYAVTLCKIRKQYKKEKKEFLLSLGQKFHALGSKKEKVFIFETRQSDRDGDRLLSPEDE